MRVPFFLSELSCFVTYSLLFCQLCTAGTPFWQLPNHPNMTFQFFQWSWQFQMLSVLWKQSMSTQGTTSNHRWYISYHKWVIIRSVLNKTVGEWTPLHHFQVQFKTSIRWNDFIISSRSLELRILGLQPTTCSPSTCGSTVCSWSWCLALSWLLSLGSWYLTNKLLVSLLFFHYLIYLITFSFTHDCSPWSSILPWIRTAPPNFSEQPFH